MRDNIKKLLSGEAEGLRNMRPSVGEPVYDSQNPL